VAARDALLANPRCVLFVPFRALLETQARPSAFQERRLWASPARTIPVPFDPPVDTTELTSREFNDNDAHIVETAAILHLPLVTTDQSLANQVYSYTPRRKHWPTVQIITLGR
jgi:hypothetical protein